MSAVNSISEMSLHLDDDDDNGKVDSAALSTALDLRPDSVDARDRSPALRIRTQELMPRMVSEYGRQVAAARSPLRSPGRASFFSSAIALPASPRTQPKSPRHSGNHSVATSDSSPQPPVVQPQAALKSQGSPQAPLRPDVATGVTGYVALAARSKSLSSGKVSTSPAAGTAVLPRNTVRSSVSPSPLARRSGSTTPKGAIQAQFHPAVAPLSTIPVSSDRRRNTLPMPSIREDLALPTTLDARRASVLSAPRSPQSSSATALLQHPERLRVEVVTLRADVARWAAQAAALESDLTASRERAIEAEARARMLTRRVTHLEAEDAALRQELASVRASPAVSLGGSGLGAAQSPSRAFAKHDGAAAAIRAEVDSLRGELIVLSEDLASALGARDAAVAELAAIEAALRAERGSGALVAARAAAAQIAAASADAASKQRALEDVRMQLSAVRSDCETAKRSFEAQLAALKSERESQIRAFDAQLVSTRAERDRASDGQLRLSAELQACKAEKESTQRSLESVLRDAEDARMRLNAMKADRDSMQRTIDSQLSALRAERDGLAHALEAQMTALRSDNDGLQRTVSNLQRALDDARKQCLELQAQKDSASALAAQSAAQVREALQQEHASREDAERARQQEKTENARFLALQEIASLRQVTCR
jgi:hypothetical protein